MDVLALNKFEKKLKSVKIEGFIINQGNKRIFEYVKNKKVHDKPTKVYSITKSVVSMLIGILIDKGLINNIHEPIYNYFPELIKSNESWKKEITIFHLLTMTSGLKVNNFQASKNWVKCILEQPSLHKPGSIFQYNSGDSHLLSAIIKNVSGMPTAVFAEKKLFSPLGVNKYLWVKDPQGIHGGGFSISLNLEDMMKIGTLLLNKGNYSSNQLISSNWIEQSASTYNHVETAPSGIYGYGYQLWTFESFHTENPMDYYYANGLFGQNIFVVPKLEMVAVTKSQLQNDNQSLPRQFFEEFLQGLDGLR
ncbi:serine hydrolase domain-containing protein [Pseudoneobacillus rhizosphaerae]|uniref:6-aminohexanoate-dimer hydrolase n=1 Tax=Pseudoneobacillus rhizosphaerae TaxID=2880968 RepID=A0A9C7L9C2_9BACI|nr:serine hydrolase [Pseudoneobacillus rhizosphaerae]CAG9606807.1 6-aminohexanoate-dimer hydrolase [Pseudoneobacillus rhizosphaerae]